MSAIYPILSGAAGLETWLEVVSNNLSNVGTSGFKRDYPLFSGVDPAPQSGTGTPGSLTLPPMFGTLSHLETDFSSGGIRATGRPLDVAIEGEGFFEVQTPEGTRYTRDGSFTLDAEGTLVTGSGYAVQGIGGFIQLPPGVVTITQNGGIVVEGVEVDALRIVDISDLSRLKKVGTNLFEAAGTKVFAVEVPQVRQGALEGSNVNPVGEMVSLIKVMRLYEATQKAIQTMDQVNEKAANEVGRLRA